MSIKWTEKASEDLLSVLNYLKENADEALAEKVANRIVSATGRLERFPLSGRQGLIPTTRELIIPELPYFIVYKVDNAEVDILRVMHTSRLWKSE